MTFCFLCDLDMYENLNVDVAFWVPDARCEGCTCPPDLRCDDLAVCERCARGAATGRGSQ